jgi:hypothetical protein
MVLNRRTGAALLISAALAATTACSTPAWSGFEAASGPRAYCEAMLPGRTIQAWESVTVRDLRSYQYGGPVARFPLKDAFAGARPSQDAAWCWVRTSHLTGSLWGVVMDHGVGRAITVTGPGGQPHGVMTRPPQVP